MHRQSVAIAFTFSLGLLAAACQAQTVISAPRTFPIVIDQPGTYELGSNLTVPAQTHGIKIMASNVVLDLKGFTIKGPVYCGTYCPPSGLASGVYINAGNVTVRNGTITGFDFAGVYFPNFMVQLEDLVLNDNYQAGVYRATPPSSLPTATMPAALRRVTAARNGLAGVYGYGMRIESSTLMQNFGAGMQSQGFNVYFDTLVMQNKGYGLSNSAYYAMSDVMRNCRFQGNSQDFSFQTPHSMGGNLNDAFQVF